MESDNKDVGEEKGWGNQQTDEQGTEKTTGQKGSIPCGECREFYLIRDMLVSERERHMWYSSKTESMTPGRICSQCMYDCRIDENDFNDKNTLMEEINRELMDLKKGGRCRGWARTREPLPR